MQQATPEHGQEEQAPAEGDSRLEIERLRVIIKDYAAICKASQRDIHRLERKQEPVAWRVYDTDGSESVYSLYEQARTAADEMNWSVEPLYRQPSLTNAERAAVRHFAEAIHAFACPYAATLRGLLERTK
jgi:hypothetical protein